MDNALFLDIFRKNSIVNEIETTILKREFKMNDEKAKRLLTNLAFLSKDHYEAVMYIINGIKADIAELMTHSAACTSAHEETVKEVVEMADSILKNGYGSASAHGGFYGKVCNYCAAGYESDPDNHTEDCLALKAEEIKEKYKGFEDEKPNN